MTKHPHLIHQQYRPDIDGIRAIAVLSVVLYHAFPDSLAGGFAGVDVFFVISGYLISTILFASLEKQRFNLIEFYVRRIQRIFPALIAVLSACLIVGWFILVGDEFIQLGKQVSAGAGFVSNFLFWSESGYFDASAETKPLLHLWSLAIEEQFYIVWPLLLATAWRLRINFLWLTVAIALLSMTANVLITTADTVAGFYSPLTRSWELMLGAVLAAINLNKHQTTSLIAHCCSVAGVSLLLAGFILLNQQSTFPGWWALLPTLGTFLIIAAGPQGFFNRTLLVYKPVIWLGLISYPLYLWHWPLLVFAGLIDHDHSKGLRALLVLIAILLAWLTYRFIEKPLRFGRKAVAMRLVLLAIMVGILLSGVLVFSGCVAPRHGDAELKPILDAVGDWQFPGDMVLLDNAIEGIYQAESHNAQTTLFIGDSHTQQYGTEIARIIRNNMTRANSALLVSDGGCPPIPEMLEDHPTHKACNDKRRYGIDQIDNAEVEAVVIGGCWNCYFIEEAKPRTATSKYDFYILDQGQKVFLRDGEGVQLALARLEAFLLEIKAKKPVYLLLDNPMGKDFSPENLFQGNRLTGLTLSDDRAGRIPADMRELQLHNQLIAIAHRAGAGILDPRAGLCTAEGCLRISDDGRPLYSDAGHLRPFAIQQFTSVLADVLIRDHHAD